MRRIVPAALLAALAFLLVVALRPIGAIDRLEVMTLDARHRLGLGRAPAGANIVVAWIDQESMDHMDSNGVPFPWPREVYGQVLQHLRAAGARAVVFDVLFDQRGNAEDDRAFAAALQQNGGDAVAMKFVGFRDGGRDGEETAAFAARALPLDTALLPRARERGLVLPIAEIAAGADRLGFVNIRADADGTYRRYDLLRTWGPAGSAARAQPSLALAALLAAHPRRRTAPRCRRSPAPAGTAAASCAPATRGCCSTCAGRRSRSRRSSS